MMNNLTCKKQYCALSGQAKASLKFRTNVGLGKRIFHLVLALLSGCYVQGYARPKDLTQYVNTLQGTNSSLKLTRGNTYPTTALPFAMHTWTPQTGRNGDGWKYQYAKDSIRGFQQAHQCSSWTNDYAVFSLMPVGGTLELDQYKRAARFSHANETGKPHYYKVKLDNQIVVELSPSERGAQLRFVFPKNQAAYVVLDGYTGMSGVEVDVKNRQITGYVHNGRGLQKNFKNYFIIQFDQHFKAQGIWENRKNERWKDRLAGEGEGFGAYIEFKAGATVQAKVASSYISPAQAALNLERELGSHKNLEDTEMTEMEMADMGQYAHGNQPIQHMVYLYNWAGQPWKAQQHAREVMARLYSGTEDGYPGDEDQGQTSSWYVLSALGFYNVCPGTDEYVMGSPAFPKITLTLEDGKKFVIEARGNSGQNVYIQSATLNGKAFSRTFLRYGEIVNGGTLKLEMGDSPNTARGTAAADRPSSLSQFRGLKPPGN